MSRFSANLGFLWSDLPLTDAILAARTAGFSAVECHWPYDTPAEQVREVLHLAGLPMLSINTRPGRVEDGEFGLAALTGRQGESESVIKEAIDYAAAVSARAVHVMAGIAEGPDAHIVFVQNLRFAARVASKRGIEILIEPINTDDVPGYFLRTVAQAVRLVDEVAEDNVKLLFDCYHVGRAEGQVLNRLRIALPYIGHIQFASVPDRGTPDHGVLDYRLLFEQVDQMGWTRPLGAEYRVVGDTAASLGWMHSVGGIDRHPGS
ncbi:MAG: TIM barrel protein [Pseudomonadota bacterium]